MEYVTIGLQRKFKSRVLILIVMKDTHGEVYFKQV